MKKFIAVILSMMMILSSFVCLLTVSAEDDVTITASQVNAEAGDTVTVEFTIANNPGWYSFTFEPVYDTTRLTLNEEDSVIPKANAWVNTDDMGGDLTVGKKLVWLGGDEDSTFNGVFMTLTFTVLADAPAGDAEVSLSYNVGDVCNYDEEDVLPVINAGKVIVAGNTPAPESSATDTTEPATTEPETTEPAVTTGPVHIDPDCDCEMTASTEWETEDEDPIVPPCDHDIEWETVVAPTCTETGKAAFDCDECGVYWEVELEPNHSFEEWVVTKSATCTVNGVKKSTCELCGTVETATVYAPGHELVVDEGYFPTCTEEGLTSGTHCEECGTIVDVQEVIPAMGHVYSDWTLGEDGTMSQICFLCFNVQIKAPEVETEPEATEAAEETTEAAEETTEAAAEETTEAAAEETTEAAAEETTEAAAEETTAAAAEDTTAATEAATTTPAAEKKSGCKSVVGTAGALVLVSVLAAGAVIRKKKD